MANPSDVGVQFSVRWPCGRCVGAKFFVSSSWSGLWSLAGAGTEEIVSGWSRGEGGHWPILTDHNDTDIGQSDTVNYPI